MALNINHKVLILDFGSQYSYLIVRRCREINIYAELLRCDIEVAQIREFQPKGIILSGGPASVYENDAPHLSSEFWDFVIATKIPVLGICYGMQEMQYHFGGKVEASTHREFGLANLNINTTMPIDRLFKDLKETTPVWMSHSDRVVELASGFQVIATSENSENAVVSDPQRNLWGVQFHPEVTHTQEGIKLLGNFAHNICGVPKGAWTMNRFAHLEIERLRNYVGDRHVIGALSGGVDSTVAAALLYNAIGNRFHGFFVDTGLLRKGEGADVMGRLRGLFPGLHIEIIDASQQFFSALKGVTEPEKKRKIIGHLFVESFVNATNQLKQNAPSGTFDNAFLLQGTLYPDVIESVSFKGPSHTIKTHHNVGGLPEKMDLNLLEPLRELFKDEVRQLGIELGIDHHTVWRHPFPGPGLAIRIIGEVTPERVNTLKEADNIFLEEIRSSGDYEKIGQAFAVLLPDCRSVGVMGDQRTYGMTVALRAVETSDFMTGDWYNMPREVLQRCSTRIINSVPDITRVCYDISSKPPATIEWE